MKIPDLSVVGGGLVGRLLAWRASRTGLKVSLYDAGSRLGEDSAAWAAAGMIAPAAEALDADPEIVAMGRHSLAIWPKWLEQLPLPVFYRDSGTVLLWHQDSADEATRFESTLTTRDVLAKLLHIDAVQLKVLEPALGTRFHQALHVPGEAQLDNRELLKAVATALEEASVDCRWNMVVQDDSLPKANMVVDCRGMGAWRDWTQLRGVRGEIVRLHAPEIELQHMLRLLRPSYSVYVVPRSEGRLVVGATCIEGNDRSPVSVRGALELLSSACSVLPSLDRARILEFATQVRPTLPDNRPAFCYENERRTLRINGLYRHGFLLSPAVVEEALAFMSAPDKLSHAGRWKCLSIADSKASDDVPDNAEAVL